MAEARLIRGGAFYDNGGNLRSSTRVVYFPAVEYPFMGLRVAAIPEPSSAAMLGVACGLGLLIRRKRSENPKKASERAARANTVWPLPEEGL